MMRSILEDRARNAKLMSAFYASQDRRHPHGISGLRNLLPNENDRRCMDTAEAGYECSEWAHGAGMVVERRHCAGLDVELWRVTLGRRG